MKCDYCGKGMPVAEVFNMEEHSWRYTCLPCLTDILIDYHKNPHLGIALLNLRESLSVYTGFRTAVDYIRRVYGKLYYKVHKNEQEWV